MQASDYANSSPKAFAGPPVRKLLVAAAKEKGNQNANHAQHGP